MKNKISLFFLIFTFAAIIPGTALAGGGVDEFAGPLEKMISILQGPMGLGISVISFIICFVGYLMKGSEIAETFKGTASAIVPVSGICCAGSLVTYLFQFTGAII